MISPLETELWTKLRKSCTSKLSEEALRPLIRLSKMSALRNIFKEAIYKYNSSLFACSSVLNSLLNAILRSLTDDVSFLTHDFVAIFT